ncbi:MAG: lysylphosphatidylglycerol synthase transmembrane domain-containing protein [Chloroflexota bacterium]|nr:lysylphosphatidylglycerol synthase transmembrane domain-containing protein [Chloroflexota bacterium]
MKRQWKLWGGLIISGVALVLALAGIEWDQVGLALRRADWRYLVPAAVSLLAYLLTRSIRWRILLGPKVRLAEAFAVTNIGYLVSNLLPFRLGDPARAVAIGLGGKAKISAALSTIVVERVLDMLMVVLLLAVTMPFVGQSGWMRETGILAGVGALVVLAVLVALALWPDQGHRFLRGLLSHLPRVDAERWMQVLGGLLDGLAALRSGRRALGLCLWSLIAWAFCVGYYYGMIRAFLDSPTLLMATFLTCAIGLGMAVPASPGAMGVFHAFARYALVLPFGVDAADAVVIAFAAHTYQYIIMILLGLWGLTRQNLSLGRLRADVTTTLTEE